MSSGPPDRGTRPRPGAVRVPRQPSAWQARAACRGKDTEALFFSAGRTAEAKAFCRGRCPVRDPCLSYALRAELGLAAAYRAGVWGGTSSTERVALDRLRETVSRPDGADLTLRGSRVTE